ncbi:protein of unknown function [Taphrina deformans PYCC 5710]|uniref:Uncharacterized protein n=1 Tax=Taphrina deformans (strain PYCC 5710 / ATCC 11124 / CBS 356.35 / IMI 108563 / JCM 9778 / NBRC 8474) TaxID=1097556 RepID=R4XBA6_TAPDE|nr:protein of unknown function [Taphrina deformans PYCC 5710]|eukprot:CCG82885.1 protein of unknown function [Taphrina deformans PYCC 5710]
MKFTSAIAASILSLVSLASADQVTVATIYRYVDATATVYQNYCPCSATTAGLTNPTSGAGTGSVGAGNPDSGVVGTGAGTPGTGSAGGVGAVQPAYVNNNGGNNNMAVPSAAPINNGGAGVAAQGATTTVYSTVFVQYVTSTQYSYFTTTLYPAPQSTITQIITKTATVTVPVTVTSTITATIAPSGGANIAPGQLTTARYSNTTSTMGSGAGVAAVGNTVTMVFSTESPVSVAASATVADDIAPESASASAFVPVTVDATSTIGDAVSAATDAASTTTDVPFAFTDATSSTTDALPTSSIVLGGGAAVAAGQNTLSLSATMTISVPGLPTTALSAFFPDSSTIGLPLGDFSSSTETTSTLSESSTTTAAALTTTSSALTSSTTSDAAPTTSAASTTTLSASTSSTSSSSTAPAGPTGVNLFAQVTQQQDGSVDPTYHNNVFANDANGVPSIYDNSIYTQAYADPTTNANFVFNLVGSEVYFGTQRFGYDSSAAALQAGTPLVFAAAGSTLSTTFTIADGAISIPGSTFYVDNGEAGKPVRIMNTDAFNAIYPAPYYTAGVVPFADISSRAAGGTAAAPPAGSEPVNGFSG